MISLAHTNLAHTNLHRSNTLINTMTTNKDVIDNCTLHRTIICSKSTMSLLPYTKQQT